MYHNLIKWRWVGKGSLKREIYGNWSVKTAADQSELVSYTDSSSEEEEDLHVDVIFDETIGPAIN